MALCEILGRLGHGVGAGRLCDVAGDEPATYCFLVILAFRERTVSVFPITRGAPVMLATPPAIPASRPLVLRRFAVKAGTVSCRRNRRAARPGYRSRRPPITWAALSWGLVVGPCRGALSWGLVGGPRPWRPKDMRRWAQRKTLVRWPILGRAGSGSADAGGRFLQVSQGFEGWWPARGGPAPETARAGS